MRNTFIIMLLVLSNYIYSQQVCSYSGRYYDLVFDKIKSTINIPYAEKPTSTGKIQQLVYDIYEPEGDTAALRAAVIMVHGGGYIDLLNQHSPDILELADKLVKRGYVCISVEYREEQNPLSLLSEEKMMKAVSRSLEDIHDAICQLMTEINDGNPYRIDTSRVVSCGVSAGAVSLLHGAFLDSINTLPGQYPRWVYEVIGEDAQQILDDRYCGGKLKGIVNISGALLEADWIANDTSMALLNIHGIQDDIVPYKKDYPFHIPTLPKLEGSYYIHEKALELGMKSYAQIYNRNHVPFIDIELEDLFSGVPFDFIFDDWILKQTHEGIRDFYYRLLNNCVNDVATPVKNNLTAPLSVFPNPASDILYIKMPPVKNSNHAIANFYTLSGEKVLSVSLQHTNTIQIKEVLPKGIYLVQILGDDNMVYIARVTVQ
jgi:hypothetical protein